MYSFSSQLTTKGETEAGLFILEKWEPLQHDTQDCEPSLWLQWK